MPTFVYGSNPLNGTADDNYIIGQPVSGSSDTVINAGAGNDLVLGDAPAASWVPTSTNDSIASATAIDSASTWSTSENPWTANDATPHTTVYANSTVGQGDFFAVTLAAGATLTVDIDFAYNSPFNAPDLDLYVDVRNGSGTVLASDDDSNPVTDGDFGSYAHPSAPTLSRDPYLTYVAPAAGVYYINVHPYGSATFSTASGYVMNVSATSHAATGNTAAGNDTINGEAGNDMLFGQGGDDIISGGDGDDFIHAGDGTDTVHGDDGNDVIWNGQNAADMIYGDAGDDVIHSGGEGSYFGGAGNDLIYAGATDSLTELLDGGTGSDTIDTTHWNSGYSINLLNGATNFGDESFLNFENVITGNGSNTIVGTLADNILRTGTGADTITASGGNDTVEGGAGGDTLDGGDGIDTLEYRFSATGVTVSLATNTASGGDAEGDTISGFENLVGSAAADTLIGNSAANTIAGGAGGDDLDGAGGNDTLDYSSGTVGVTVSLATNTASGGHATGDTISGFENVTGSLGNDTLTGTDLANTLRGGDGADALNGRDGNDILNGGAAVDALIGGLGDDRYYVDNVADYVEELGGGGIDRVFASVSYALGAAVQVETLSTTDNAGTSAINLTGNGFAQTITGNAGANTLIGGAGADTLNGLGGNDKIYVDNVGDVVVEAAGGGSDRVLASVSYTLGAAAQVEILSTTDNAGTAAINLAGNGFAQTITGNAGANTLIGGAGADTLNGLGGNDKIYVDNVGDVVVEAAGGGSDRVLASVSYTLGAAAQVEIFSTTDNAGTAAINLAGNGFAQTITGNAGANTLIGGAGADTLNGLGGNDKIYVDNVADVVVEAAGGGSDRVLASVSYTLGAAAQVEILSTTDNAGTDAINLAGNGFANSLIGNAGANTLIGGAGADTLSGLGGNDRYYVDNVGDVVVEAAGGGSDRVLASVSYSLGAAAQVEILSTTDNAGTAAINLTGNGFANSITGNAGANVLDGGAGADTLNGLGGADTFRFTTALGAGNVDTITGYSVADDRIQLENAVFTGLAAGALAAGAFNTGAAASQADDRIIYNSATGALLFDADGVGGAAGVQFATLAGGLALTASEFLVI